jgi:hypothetical protein
MPDISSNNTQYLFDMRIDLGQGRSRFIQRRIYRATYIAFGITNWVGHTYLENKTFNHNIV